MKNSRRIYMPLAVAALSLGFLSGGDVGSFRKIACLEGSEEIQQPAQIPLEDDLFKKVRSEAEEAQLKKGALEFYNILSQNELQYYIDAQSALTAYGIKGSLFNFSTPSLWTQFQANPNQSNFQFGNLGFQNGPQLTNLWGWKTSPALQSSVQLPSLAAAPVSPALSSTILGAQPVAQNQMISNAPASALSPTIRW